MPALLYRTTIPRPDDPDILDRVHEAIIKGHPPKTAAALAGISESTFDGWMRQGKKDLENWKEGQELGNHARFATVVKEAFAVLVDTRLGRIDESGKKGNWAADMTLLARRWPQEFGERRQVTVDGTIHHVPVLPAVPEQHLLGIVRDKLEEARPRLMSPKDEPD